MAGDWIATTIGEQATLQRGIDITKADQRPGLVPVVSSGGVASYHDSAVVSGPGVVLGRKGVVGSVYFIPSDYWPHDTTLWVKDFHGNDPRFVYFFFKGMAPRIATMDVGSANPTLNRNHVHPIEICWPPLPEQRTIAHILGTLDDKIELNRRMSETLERMADSLFRRWLVDGDAPCAKPGEPVPAVDMTVRPLDRMADFLNGAACQKYPARDGEPSLPVIKIRELSQGITNQSDCVTKQIPEKWHVRNGDVLFSWSGTLIAKVWTGGPAALNQHLFKVTSAEYPKWFYLRWVLHHLDDFRGVAADKATTMGHIKRHHLSDAMCLVPPATTLEAMTKLMEPLLDRQIACDSEASTLAGIRDALLPKLISGELRIPDAERLVSEVT